jgi:hypothetical protein
VWLSLRRCCGGLFVRGKEAEELLMKDGNARPACPPGFLTRAEVARRLRISQSTVRRLEPKLQPVLDEKGWHRFDPRQVQAHLENAPRPERKRPTRRSDRAANAAAEDDGKHDARLFRLFEENCSHAAVVIETGLPSQVVRRAYLEWRSGYRVLRVPDAVNGSEMEAQREAAEWRAFEEGLRSINADLEKTDPLLASLARPTLTRTDRRRR